MKNEEIKFSDRQHTMITGASLSIFGLILQLFLVYSFDPYSLPAGAKLIVDIFPPTMFLFGSIIFGVGYFLMEEPKKSDWDAKKEVQKYLDGRGEPEEE